MSVVHVTRSTRGEINALERAVIARTAPVGTSDPAANATLPDPVRRRVSHTFPDGLPDRLRYVEVEQVGAFRRPLTDGLNPTTARQVASPRQTDMVFSADTPILGRGWAVAHDRHIDGDMEMNPRLLSAISVMHESSNPELDAIALRRWLVEAPLYPMAFLPGGPVRWEAVDATHALTIVEAHGIRAEALATFDASGALTPFEATAPGDLTTTYHGSGEYPARSDYRLVDGVRVPGFRDRAGRRRGRGRALLDRPGHEDRLSRVIRTGGEAPGPPAAGDQARSAWCSRSARSAC